VSVESIDLHEVVSEQAITDELTGLSNPRRFRELIEKEVAWAERFGHPLSLLILDIDDFKQVNDTYGHLQGDEVLRTMGRILLEESGGGGTDPARGRIGCDPGHREPAGRDGAGLGAGREGSDRGRRRGAVPSQGSRQEPF
jgi:GGDEF domain-containing protein